MSTGKKYSSKPHPSELSVSHISNKSQRQLLGSPSLSTHCSWLHGFMPPRVARSAAMRVWMLMGWCGSSSKNSGSLVDWSCIPRTGSSKMLEHWTSCPALNSHWMQTELILISNKLSIWIYLNLSSGWTSWKSSTGPQVDWTQNKRSSMPGFEIWSGFHSSRLKYLANPGAQVHTLYLQRPIRQRKEATNRTFIVSLICFLN